MGRKDVIANDLRLFQEDIRKMEDLISRMETIRTKVFNELAALNGMWEGPAHDGLMARFEADNEFTVEFIKFLRGVKENYREAHKAYTECEGRVANAISSMNLEVG